MSATPEHASAEPLDSGLPKLAAMLQEMRDAPEVVRPSRYWEHLAGLNLKQLEDDGLASFKRTINRNYFQFQLTSPTSPQFRAVLRAWLAHPRPRALGARLDKRLKLPPELSGVRARLLGSRIYAIYLALLWEYASLRDSRGLLRELEEPLLGDPIYVTFHGRRVSEDLCNSVLEYTAITEGMTCDRQIASVIELGGGYGRLAWVFLSAFPHVRYTMVDIPPALAVSEHYLSNLFPERRVFGFRHFDDPDEVADELAAAQIVFLTPNQLDLLPPQKADLFVNVSSLHEMRPHQIDHYLGVVARHCDGCFYSKQWLRSVNEMDELVFTHDDYPIPAAWRVLFDRTHPVQVEFFEALYDMTPSAA